MLAFLVLAALASKPAHTFEGKSAAEWTAALGDCPASDDSEHALRALATLGPEADAAVPRVMHCVEKGRLVVSALDTLTALGPKATPPLLALLHGEMGEALEDRSPNRDIILVIGALRAVGPAAAPAIPDLVTLLGGDVYQGVAENAEALLSGLGSAAVPSLVKAAHDLDAARKTRAVHALLAMNEGRATDLLNEQFRDRDLDVRDRAARVAAEAPSTHPRVAALLLSDLKGTDEDLQGSAAMAALRVYKSSGDLTDALLGALNGKSAWTRTCILRTLIADRMWSQLSGDFKAAVRKAATDPDWTVARHARLLLASVGDQALATP